MLLFVVIRSPPRPFVVKEALPQRSKKGENGTDELLCYWRTNKTRKQAEARNQKQHNSTMHNAQ